jgi:hypothetical protein
MYWLLRLLVVLAVTGVSHHAIASKRVALVVGNSQYEHTVDLLNPENDASDMTYTLMALGFQVFGGQNLSRRDFADQLAKFGRSVRGADVALFYYAGHGLQVRGENYLVPTDAKVEFEDEIDLYLISLNQVMQQLERGSQSRIVILDACRNNPFAADLSRNIGRGAVSLAGLGRVATEKGSFIAFATQPDAVASDGSGRNSPFTKALLTHMSTPNLPISEVMIRVRNEVIEATLEKQVPWDSSSLVTNVYLAGSDTVAEETPQTAGPAFGLRGSLAGNEATAYEAAVAVNTCGGYEAFIRLHEGTLYAELANSQPENSQIAALEPPGDVAVRSLAVRIPDISGRKVRTRPISGDDRDMGWVYINNCGVSGSEAARIRKAINDYRFKNLRLVPGNIATFDAGSPECQNGTVIRVYSSPGRGSIAGIADRAANELSAVMSGYRYNAQIARDSETDAIEDRYRFDIWLTP